MPGCRDCTPLWTVRAATWREGATPRLLRSRSAVAAAVVAGQVTVEPMPVVVNCPVL